MSFFSDYGISFLCPWLPNVTLRHSSYFYWNHLYTHRPNEIINSLQQQTSRTRKLQKFPKLPIRNLKDSKGVIEALSSPDRPHIIEIEYRINADTPFVEVMKSTLENLYPDLQSKEYLFEPIMLKEAFFNGVEVTYLNEGRKISKQKISFGSFFNSSNDTERMNALSTSELLFDEDDISCQEKADLLLNSLILTEHRLLACQAEVDTIIAEQESEEFEGRTLRESWIQSIESMREELARTVGGLPGMASHMLNEVLG